MTDDDVVVGCFGVQCCLLFNIIDSSPILFFLNN